MSRVVFTLAIAKVVFYWGKKDVLYYFFGKEENEFIRN